LTSGRVLSLDAERSVRLLMTTLAQHRRQEAVLATSRRPWRGRLRMLTTSAASAQVRRQATLVRLTSIVEAHVAEQLVQRFEPHAPPPREAILDDVYVRAEDNAIGSWPKMTDHYGRWFGIRMNQRTCPSWRRIEALTNARNAVAHGLGELTRRMARRDQEQLRRDFATLDIEMVGGAIVLSERTLRSAAAAGREFVGWLDEALTQYDAGVSVGASP